MHDETTPDDESTLPADPFEAELVAYLDGELEPAAARKVESRLATDADARARATAYKKTFDLLDFLPKPEPSPTFTTRTLDRLPAMKSKPVQPATQQPVPSSPSQTVNSPTVASSSIVPLATATSSLAFAPTAPNRWGLWAAGLLLAISACVGIGYFASDAVHPYLVAAKAQRETPNPAPAEELPSTDHHLVEKLPLYAAVDDLDFVRELSQPEFFGEEPAVTYDLTTKPPPVEQDKPSGAAFAKLASAFKALPPVRQQAIRDLDKQLQALDAPTREQRFRVLEVYTVWLDKLPAPERKQVLLPESARGRLDEIRKLRNQQWLDGLPPAQRAKLNSLPASQQIELIRQLKEDEMVRREDWAFHRAHAEDIVANKIPWPFDTPARQKEVSEFMRVSFRLDDAKGCRFEETDRQRYNSALTFANDANELSRSIAWYGYGRTVSAMMRKYDKYLLPEPATGHPVTTYEQLAGAGKFFSKEKSPAHLATVSLVGKWPDFALEIHKYANGVKGEKLPLLGPARPSDFKEPLRTFVTTQLVPALPATDRKILEGLEGKWPDYPKEVVRFAKQQDLVAPGLMLPVSPKRWDSMYGFGPRIKP
ncbi:MAG: hypothetical protein K8U57_00280 [Planctomycetes bacterium]|nr:hypothetical protein [Planctomycetota bacterium]